MGAPLQAALAPEPGVTAVAYNAKTGSLLVEYEVGFANPNSILQRIATFAGLEMPAEDARPRGREPALVAIDVARELNDIVHELTGYRGDLRVMVPAGLAALAAVSFGVSKDKMPRWDNLLYWSYNVFWQLHRREIEERARRSTATSPNDRSPESEPRPGDDPKRMPT